MDRPVVVNSLLCFIHNYRQALLPHQLDALLRNYFSKSAIAMAQATLAELLPPHLASGSASASASASGAAAEDLLQLFDRISQSPHSPVFAAADLNALPLTLISDDEDSKNELLREIRQLKRFIQDALNGKLDEPPSQIDSEVQTTTISEEHLYSSNLQRQGQSSAGCYLSPRSCFKSGNVSCSSPELPTSTNLFNTPYYNTPCSSLIPTTLMSPVSPYSRPENYHYNTVGATAAVTAAAGSMMLNSTASNSNGISTSPMNHFRQKRGGCGNRLDAMIRKLADKQKEKEEAAAASAAAAAAATDTNVMATSSTRVPSASTSSSSSSSVASSTTATIQEQSPPPASIWHTQMIDPLAYVNMLRTMTSAATVVSQSSIFPSVGRTAHTNRSKSDSLTEFGENMDDGSNELGEKNSNESSPSPSDSSNNVDEIAYTAADLAEKPFTCEHTNCHKRFANKFLLKKHQFIHTGLRPHCCPFCGKRFNRKDNLLRHKKTHLANALGTDITSALSSDDFMLQLGAEKAAIKFENEPEEESEN